MPLSLNELISNYQQPQEYIQNLATICNQDPNAQEFSEAVVSKFDIIHGFFKDGRVKEGDWQGAKKMYEQYQKQQQSKKDKKVANPSSSEAKSKNEPSSQADDQPDIIKGIQDNVRAWGKGTADILDIVIEEEVNNFTEEIKPRFAASLNEKLITNQQETEVFFDEVKQAMIGGIKGKKLSSNSPPPNRALSGSQNSSRKQRRKSENGTTNT